MFVGNVPVKVTYAGRSGCCAGLDQIAIEAPASPTGCFVPVVVRSGGVVSNFTTLSIGSSGQVCSNDTPGVPTSILSRGLSGEQLTIGAIALGPVRILGGVGFPFSRIIANRLSALLRKPVSEEDVRRLLAAYRAKKRGTARKILAKYGVHLQHVDPRLAQALRTAAAMDEQGVAVGFGKLRGLGAAFTSQLASNFTPLGTCMVTGGLPNAPFPQSKRIDAGASLTFDGPMGRRTLQRASNGQYFLSLGAGFPNATLPTGVYSITGTGGSDIGPFSASISLSSTLTWTNKAAIDFFDRTRPLTVTWAGGAVPGYVLIGGGAQTVGAGTTAFLCVEDSRKGTFTIPNYVLASLPPVSRSDAVLLLAQHPLSKIVAIHGLDLVYIADVSNDHKSVGVR